jgi:aspartate kinase
VLADARSFFITDSTFTFAKPKLATIKKRMAPLARKLRSGEIIVTQGFIGATERGETTTIGRGGSDYSASIMGVALKADEIQIWTDVAGIYTCDPRITPSAFAQEFVSFTEASVMARYGAKVLHPETIGPAVAAHIPVKVLSSRYPQLAGTTIVHTAVVDQPVTGIAVIKKIRILHLLSKNKIPGANNMQILHSALDKLHIVPLASSIAFDNALLAFSADETPTEAFVHFEHFADITTVNDCSLITLVGAGLADAKGVAARLFQAVKNIRCYMISFGGLSNAINIAVDAGDCDKAVRLIHKTFFE